MSKIQLPVRIEQNDLNTLKQLAEDDNRPLSNYKYNDERDPFIHNKKQRFNRTDKYSICEQ